MHFFTHELLLVTAWRQHPALFSVFTLIANFKSKVSLWASDIIFITHFMSLVCWVLSAGFQLDWMCSVLVAWLLMQIFVLQFLKLEQQTYQTLTKDRFFCSFGVNLNWVWVAVAMTTTFHQLVFFVTLITDIFPLPVTVNCTFFPL